jgi:hypothetical protein
MKILSRSIWKPGFNNIVFCINVEKTLRDQNMCTAKLCFQFQKIFIQLSMIISVRPIKRAFLQLFFIVFLYCDTKYAIDMAS